MSSALQLLIQLRSAPSRETAWLRKVKGIHAGQVSAQLAENLSERYVSNRDAKPGDFKVQQFNTICTVHHNSHI
jgi:hypothetical protein